MLSNVMEELITGEMREQIEEELSQREPEPKKIKKVKQHEMLYASTNSIIESVKGWKKLRIKDLLRDKKCSELMLIS